MDGILLVHKPSGMTSHDVVFKIKKLLHIKKVGHCGTLDPNASGVLVLGINKATKLMQFLESNDKRYKAELSLGEATTTYDSEGSVTEKKEYQNDITLHKLNEVISSFVGKQKQIPPIYSAIKVNGKKLYEYARNKQEVEIKEREITIHQISLESFVDNKISFIADCSKGTYIRSLCIDIAAKLGYPGHMSDLVRLQSGIFSLDDCYSLEDVESGNFKLISMDDALSFMPSLVIEDEEIVYHGKLIASTYQEKVAIYNKEKKLLAVYEPNGHGFLKSVRGLW